MKLPLKPKTNNQHDPGRFMHGKKRESCELIKNLKKIEKRGIMWH